MTKRYHQASLVSCEIPWGENDEFLEDVFRQEVRSTLQKFTDVYIFGTAGEGYAVTNALFKQIVGVFSEETAGEEVHPMVGVIGMSTAQIVERIGIAHDKGFRMFQISLPPWGELQDDEYLIYFKDVCGSFPDSRFLHYNLPRARRVLLGPDYRRVEEAVGNLAATKNGRTDIRDIISITTNTSELQHFWGEYGFPHGSLYGECSLLSSFGAMFPTKTKEFFDYGVTGQIGKLFRMQAEYLAVSDAFQEPAVGPDRIDGAYDKMIQRAGGIDMPLRLLSPYQGFDLDTYERCVSNVRDNYPGWLEE